MQAAQVLNALAQNQSLPLSDSKKTIRSLVACLDQENILSSSFKIIADNRLYGIASRKLARARSNGITTLRELETRSSSRHSLKKQAVSRDVLARLWADAQASIPGAGSMLRHVLTSDENALRVVQGIASADLKWASGHLARIAPILLAFEVKFWAGLSDASAEIWLKNICQTALTADPEQSSPAALCKVLAKSTKALGASNYLLDAVTQIMQARQFSPSKYTLDSLRGSMSGSVGGKLRPVVCDAMLKWMVTRVGGHGALSQAELDTMESFSKSSISLSQPVSISRLILIKMQTIRRDVGWLSRKGALWLLLRTNLDPSDPGSSARTHSS